MEIKGIGIIIIIVVAYFPVIYRMQKRIRQLEDDVNELKSNMK